MMSYLFIGGIALAILLILFILTAICYRTVVPTNKVHIVNSSKGRAVYGRDSAHGNTYYAFPSWIPLIGVNVTTFDTSNFGISLNEYEAYDFKRLPFQVDVHAFFVMDDADVVSQRVSSQTELCEHLRQIVSGAVRKVTGSMPLERILSARSELSEQFDMEVANQLTNWGVKAVNSIEFLNIQDSPTSDVIRDIQQKEESRINRESRESRAENEQAAKIKEIEAMRKVSLEKENAEQQISTRQAEKQQAVGIAQELSKQAVADQTKATTQKNLEVQRIKETTSAEIAKEVALTNAEQLRRELEIKAESQKVTMAIEAEARKVQQVLEAEANKTATELKAEADKIVLQLKAEAQLLSDKHAAEGALEIQKAEAFGIEAIGTAKADAEQKMQMASVTAQSELATKIGENKPYQDYLLQVKQIEVNGQVGVAQSKALENANIQIVGGAGTEGGLSLGGMLTGLVSTDAGRAIVERVAGKNI